jgi:hypothetical protein
MQDAATGGLGWQFNVWTVSHYELRHRSDCLSQWADTPIYFGHIVEMVRDGLLYYQDTQHLLYRLESYYEDYEIQAAASPGAPSLDRPRQVVLAVQQELLRRGGDLQNALLNLSTEPIVGISLELAQNYADAKAQADRAQEDIARLEAEVERLKRQSTTEDTPLTARALAERLRVPRKTLLHHTAILRSRPGFGPVAREGNADIFTQGQCEIIELHIRNHGRRASRK